MPLIIMCGLPCSGKTKIADSICEILRSKIQQEEEKLSSKMTILKIDDFTNGKFSKNIIYANSVHEKEHRAFLRSRVQKFLRQDTIIILDSLNYIKSFRYELFCLAKSVKTTYAVIYCETNLHNCLENNNQQKSEKYDEKIIQDLNQRFEEPRFENRWDTPLFQGLIFLSQFKNDRQVQIAEFCDHVISGKKLAPNQSTQSQPSMGGNFLFELEKSCQMVIQEILNSNLDTVVFPACTVPLTTPGKKWTLGELSRLKRQFLQYMKQNTPKDLKNVNLANLFVNFLNKSV
uniref:Protein KTI12 homolog n=1 Tax=Romanomermis culicivorax TaxID=13658 RepID=A0A915KNT4_ROMCU